MKMKVRIKTKATHYGIFYDVQYKVYGLFWKHYTRCNDRYDAIQTTKNLEKVPKIYSSWQELEAWDKKNGSS